MDAIFDAAAARGGGVNTTLVELSRGGHFAMAGIGRKQLEDLGRRMGQLLPWVLELILRFCNKCSPK